MILAIDIGNTNIVIGVLNGDRTELIERITTDANKTPVEYAIIMKSLFEINDLDYKKIRGGIISSSVPPVTQIVKQAAEKLLSKPIMEVGPGVKTGVNIKIDDPAQLGPDLLVGAVAGISEYGAPLIIIDMGTATTFSVISDKRQFVGGMIIPGIRVSLDGMSQKTAHLPKISLDAPKKFIGTNTIDSMKSGVIYGNASCIDGMVERIWEDLGMETKVVATGGIAKAIIPHCKKEIVLDDQLLLKGLKIIYEKNQK